MRHVNKKNILYCLFLFVIALTIFYYIQGKPTYEYIAKENILENLHAETAENFTTSAISDCDYHDILFDESTLHINQMDVGLTEGHRIKEGGEYAPAECRPKYSTALIVPFRDRVKQLHYFMVYMHNFLQHQHIHYRIYLVEQVDSKYFNRAKLINVGAVVAMQAGYPCLVLHDIDKVPLNLANLYACTKCPRHISSSMDRHRFTLPYITFFGGVVSIISKQFKSINGMSNEYCGWGGEDDDLYTRIEAHKLKVCRFQPETSRYYTTFNHPDQPLGKKRSHLLKFAKERMIKDGLNSLKYTKLEIMLHPLFTHVMVYF